MGRADIKNRVRRDIGKAFTLASADHGSADVSDTPWGYGQLST